MTTQVQIRGNTQATQEARTLVGRELDVNTTDWRLSIHNGSTAGGIRHVNCFDQQNSEFNYAQASGTNALTASMRMTPTGYITGAVYIIKISANNTASVTLNLNSLGAKTLKKLSNGALVNLVAGDISTGMMIQVLYDGTHFQVIAGLGGLGTRTLFVPTGNVGSYTSSDCVYVDYGYVVTVCFRFEPNFAKTWVGGAWVWIINNMPFASETHASCVVRVLLGGFIDAYIPSGLDDLRIAAASQYATIGEVAGSITYIKD